MPGPIQANPATRGKAHASEEAYAWCTSHQCRGNKYSKETKETADINSGQQKQKDAPCRQHPFSCSRNP